MNRDEAREAAWRKFCRENGDTDIRICAMPANELFNAGYQAGSEGRWVPIRSVDDLPKENGEYIWQRKDGRIGAGHYHTALHKDEIVNTCVAWHRLPPPYQEDKDDIEEKIRKVTERGDAITGDEFERERR